LRPRLRIFLLQLLSLNCLFKGRNFKEEKEVPTGSKNPTEDATHITISPSKSLMNEDIIFARNVTLPGDTLLITLLKMILTEEEAAYCMIGPPKGVPLNKWYCCIPTCNQVHRFDGVNYRLLQYLRGLTGMLTPQQIKNADKDYKIMEETYKKISAFDGRNLKHTVSKEVPDVYTPLLLIPVHTLPQHAKLVLINYFMEGSFDMGKGIDNLFICHRHFMDNPNLCRKGFAGGHARFFSFQRLYHFLIYRPMYIHFNPETPVCESTQARLKTCTDPGLGPNLLLSDWNPKVPCGKEEGALEPFNEGLAKSFNASFKELQGCTEVVQDNGQISLYRDGLEVHSVIYNKPKLAIKSRSKNINTDLENFFCDRFMILLKNVEKLQDLQKQEGQGALHPLIFALLCHKSVYDNGSSPVNALECFSKGDLSPIKEFLKNLSFESSKSSFIEDFSDLRDNARWDIAEVKNKYKAFCKKGQKDDEVETETLKQEVGSTSEDANAEKSQKGSALTSAERSLKMLSFEDESWSLAEAISKAGLCFEGSVVVTKEDFPNQGPPTTSVNWVLPQIEPKQPNFKAASPRVPREREDSLCEDFKSESDINASRYMTAIFLVLISTFN